MAELPQARMQVYHPPFFHTGVDYFGPLLVRQERSLVKRYGCIFTCMTSRAIHLEVAHSLTSDSFISALAYVGLLAREVVLVIYIPIMGQTLCGRTEF